MVDKCDVRIPHLTPFTREFAALYPELRNPEKSPFHSSQYYLAVGDLRDVGYGAILHMGCRYGKGDHKLELVDAGLHGFSFLLREIERIFLIDSYQLELMRVDLAADVPGVPVMWFHKNVRARFKQFSNAGMGGLEYQQLGKKGLQTLYFGTKPNCYRIYDKTAEYEDQYRTLLRSSHGAEIPSFEARFGISRESILTRVERQIGGGRIPREIRNLRELHSGALDFDPFANLEFIGASHEQNPSDFPRFNDYLVAIAARQLVQEMGNHSFRQLVNLHTGNGSRWFKRHGDSLYSGLGITKAEFSERYRDSLSKQLAA